MDGKVPDGCAIVTVSDKVSAHLMLRGIIDPAKEIEKLEKKESQLRTQLQKLEAAMKVAGYKEKVPFEVQQANSEKLVQTEVEMKRLRDAVKSLETM